MKRITTAFVFCFLCGECFSQAGEWVWIKGDSVPYQPGNFGVQGVPSPTNNPPSLYEPCEWTDLNGNFWLFGGMDELLQSSYSDLWKYNPLTDEWTWIKGPGISGMSPVFGTQGVPSPANNPDGPWFGAASWIDLQGNLWLFSPCNLWMYSIASNEWTWVNRTGFGTILAVYGIQGIPNIANHPGYRSETVAAWTDNTGDLWFFGGADAYSISGADPINDLWRYHIPTNEWTWMNGDSTENSPGNYGTLGIEDPSNNPPARWAYTHWKDTAGMLWFFGGGFFDTSKVTFNDLWRYNTGTNSWTWMGGSNLPDTSGTYGTKCNEDTANIPPPRFENRAVFTDSNGNFWMFGGWAYSDFRNDLWKYCVADNKWIWISGDSIPNPTGSWGIKGVSNPSNKPDCRMGAIAWGDHNNHFYLFGGDAYFGRHNDLWKYTIDTTCGVCPTATGIQQNNFTNELLVFPNPTNSSLTISFSSLEKQTVELRIYNTLGELNLFQSFKTLEKVFSTEINVEKWSDGIYFLQVKMKEGMVSKKVVVEK